MELISVQTQPGIQTTGVPFQLTWATLFLMVLSEMEMFGGERVTAARDVGKKVFSHSTVEDPVRLAARWRKHPVAPPSQGLNTKLVSWVQTFLEESIGSSTLDCPKPIFTAPCQCMEGRKKAQDTVPQGEILSAMQFVQGSILRRAVLWTENIITLFNG